MSDRTSRPDDAEGTKRSEGRSTSAAAPPDPSTIDAFRDRLHGAVLTPGDDGYDEARIIWNAMIDREPEVIARCSGTADVITAVNFAREQDLLLAVRGGGHNVAGHAVCDDGLMIDLSTMNGVRVDPASRTARVGGGALWGDVDHETQAFGLATTGGIVSTTGVAGLTLGGGLGYLSRKYGLAHDNLRSVDVVTADGDLVHASEDENADLFWGIRGGGGNYGVVTSFEFDLHEVGPEVLAGLLVYRHEDAADVLRFYREFMADAPDEVQCYGVFSKGSPALGLPEPLHGETIFLLLPCYAGDVESGTEVLRPLREFGKPIADTVGPMPYTALQSMLDDRWAAGNRNYWKSRDYRELSDDAIDTMVELCDSSAPFFSVFVEWMEGAIGRADADATAYPHRDMAFDISVLQLWTDPDVDDEYIGWAREFHEAMEPHAADGVYMNYMSEDESERVPEAYGDRYERLRDLKDEWDPDNLFRMNQNIEPTE